MRFQYALLISTYTACNLLFATPSRSSAAPQSSETQARGKAAKADLNADIASDREVIQALEHAKKQLQAQKVKDPTGHRQGAINSIQKAMAEIRAKTSKPGH